MPQQQYEYKVVIYREPLLGSILLGGAKVDPRRYTDFLNDNARDGWEVVTMEKDIRRELLFFKREAFVTLLKRSKEA